MCAPGRPRARAGGNISKLTPTKREDSSNEEVGCDNHVVVVVRFNEAGQTSRIVVNHRPLGSVLLWSRLMGEHFAGTHYANYFLRHGAAAALHGAGVVVSGSGGISTAAG